MFRFPYHWRSFRTICQNLRSGWRDIQTGLPNILRWIPVIWHDADFDHSYLTYILIYKFTRMAGVLENGHGFHGNRYAKQLRICAELCRRMENDDYFVNADKRFPERGKAWADLIRSQEKQDQELLGRMISKHYAYWWD